MLLEASDSRTRDDTDRGHHGGGARMRRHVSGVMILSLALWVALSAAGTAADRPSTSADGTGGPGPASPPASDPGVFRSIRGGLCPDIAYTDLFRKKGFIYLHTAEFADAVSAVANGTSSFSPPEIPAHWPAAASAWRLHFLAHEWAMRQGEPVAPLYDLRPGWENFQEAGETCSPFLLFLASREYRSRPGHGNANVVYPYLVPAAVEDLGERIRPFAYRVAEISSRIAKAEELDAGNCAPGKLSLAKAALEEGRTLAWTSHYDAGKTDPPLTRSAITADDLLTERRYAQRHGIICYSR